MRIYSLYNPMTFLIVHHSKRSFRLFWQNMLRMETNTDNYKVPLIWNYLKKSQFFLDSYLGVVYFSLSYQYFWGIHLTFFKKQLMKCHFCDYREYKTLYQPSHPSILDIHKISKLHRCCFFPNLWHILLESKNVMLYLSDEFLLGNFTNWGHSLTKQTTSNKAALV